MEPFDINTWMHLSPDEFIELLMRAREIIDEACRG